MSTKHAKHAKHAKQPKQSGHIKRSGRSGQPKQPKQSGQPRPKLPIRTVLTIVKYAVPLLLSLVLFLRTRETNLLLSTSTEIVAVFLLTELLLSKLPRVGYCANSLLILLINIQLAVYYFGNSFISMVMMTNLEFVEDLSGNAVVYVLGAALCVLVSFLPIKRFLASLPVSRIVALCTVAILYNAFLITSGPSYSPVYNYYSLAQSFLDQYGAKSDFSTREVNTNTYYRDGVLQERKMPAGLGDNPNVIVVFIEGLSDNVTTDGRNITPNISRLKKQSLSFHNYYNHTSPTLRGLIGQLYSGYQYDNHDVNGTTSIMDILESNGYKTVFINTEPSNREFASYVDSLGFEEIRGSKDVEHAGYKLSEEDNYYSDAEAFDLLYETVEDYSKQDESFLACMYTFGTHASFNSPDELFEDGSNPELNKFFNMDYQFGAFMDKLERQGLLKNSIVVFTTDHATYFDKAFSDTFPNYKRDHVFLDKIPFFIYYEGVTPETVDAHGRNSLCMAPTVLDLIDIDGPNYFLGSSLFGDCQSDIEYCYNENGSYYSSKEARISPLAGSDLEQFKERLFDYFSIAAKGSSFKDAEIEIEPGVSGDYELHLINVPEEQNVDCLAIGVWRNQDQSDIAWTIAREEDGRYDATILESDLPSGKGKYSAAIRIIYRDGKSEPLATTSVFFP